MGPEKKSPEMGQAVRERRLGSSFNGAGEKIPGNITARSYLADYRVASMGPEKKSPEILSSTHNQGSKP